MQGGTLAAIDAIALDVYKRQEQFGVEAESLSRETNFVDDLNADSLDVVELSMTIEDEFGLGEIYEDDLKAIKTIGDLVDYVEHASGN